MSMSMTAKAAWTPLWMQCDDHGIFEWKPIVLKALIFPADNVDFAAVLSELEKLDCIRRITIDGKPCGIVRNFAKYQRPKNPSYRFFKENNLPSEHSVYICERGSAPPVLPQSSPSPPVIPPQMKEEGGSKEEVKKEEVRPVAKPQPSSSSDFAELKKIYPQRLGDYKWSLAERKFNSLVKTGVDPKMILEAAKRLGETHRKLGNIGTQFVPMPTSWLNSEDFVEYAAASFSSSVDDGLIEVLSEDELVAWDSYARAQGKKSYPRNSRGGWRFPSRWPPGHGVAETEPVIHAFVPKLQSM